MSAIAIVNCRFQAPGGMISSGVVLIEQGVIVACGPDYSIALPVKTRLLDADRGEILSGKRNADGNLIADEEVLRPGRPATLFRRSRFEETTWAMEAGVVIRQPDEALPACMFWEQERTASIITVIGFLKQRSETISVQRAQKPGVDLFWRFQKAGSMPETASISVFPTFASSSESFSWIQRQAGHSLADQNLHGVKAHWLFCLDGAQSRLYCLPRRAFMRWLSEQASGLPEDICWPVGATRPFIGRTLSLTQVRAAIPRTKIVYLEDDAYFT